MELLKRNSGSIHIMLVFAINMPGSLVTIPIAFSIGFKGRAVEYLTLWKALKVVLKKFGGFFKFKRNF